MGRTDWSGSPPAATGWASSSTTTSKSGRPSGTGRRPGYGSDMRWHPGHRAGRRRRSPTPGTRRSRPTAEALRPSSGPAPRRDGSGLRRRRSTFGPAADRILATCGRRSRRRPVAANMDLDEPRSRRRADRSSRHRRRLGPWASDDEDPTATRRSTSLALRGSTAPARRPARHARRCPASRALQDFRRTDPSPALRPSRAGCGLLADESPALADNFATAPGVEPSSCRARPPGGLAPAGAGDLGPPLPATRKRTLTVRCSRLSAAAAGCGSRSTGPRRPGRGGSSAWPVARRARLLTVRAHCPLEARGGGGEDRVRRADRLRAMPPGAGGRHPSGRA